MSRYPFPDLNTLPEDIRARIVEVQEKAGFIPNVFLAFARRPAEWRAFFAYHDALMLKEEAQPASMRVYPNPAVEVLYVQIAQERVGVGAQLEIFDALGRVHRSEQMNGSVKSLDLSALSTGIYWLRVLAEGRTLTAKFSKE